jgi:hypothetical protein
VPPDNSCPCTVSLTPDSPGYLFAAAAARATLPSIRIAAIQAVVNRDLIARFQDFVKQQQPAGVPLWAFHGCGSDCCKGGSAAVRGIPQEGLRLGQEGRIYGAAKALYVDLGFASKTADGQHHQMFLCQMYCAPWGIGGWECCRFCWANGPTCAVTAPDAVLPRFILTYNCGHG